MSHGCSVGVPVVCAVVRRGAGPRGCDDAGAWVTMPTAPCAGCVVTTTAGCVGVGAGSAVERRRRVCRVTTTPGVWVGSDAGRVCGPAPWSDDAGCGRRRDDAACACQLRVWRRRRVSDSVCSVCPCPIRVCGARVCAPCRSVCPAPCGRGDDAAVCVPWPGVCPIRGGIYRRVCVGCVPCMDTPCGYAGALMGGRVF